MRREGAMPIPLRPIDPPPVMPQRRRERVPLAHGNTTPQLGTPQWMLASTERIRREPDRAVTKEGGPSENDGWPCLPLARG